MDFEKANYKTGERITIFCIIGNIALSLLKLLAGLLGNSKALVSDAFNSASDVISTLMVLISIKIAQKPVDKDHPYGHGKIEPIAAAFVGITMVYAAFTIVKDIFTSVIRHSFVTPSLIAIVGAVLSIIIKEIMFRITYREGKKINSVSLVATAWDHRSDVYCSAGALLGVIGSIAGEYFNLGFLEYMDPLAGAIVACMIFRTAFNVLKHSINGLMDSSPDIETINRIKETVLNTEGVLSISWIKARYMGRHLFVDIGIGVDPTITVEQGHDISEIVTQNILKNIYDVIEVLVHIDPAVK